MNGLPVYYLKGISTFAFFSTACIPFVILGQLIGGCYLLTNWLSDHETYEREWKELRSLKGSSGWVYRDKI